MALPSNYSECTGFGCEGIYKNTESCHDNLCRRCREARVSRKLRGIIDVENGQGSNDLRDDSNSSNTFSN